MKKIINYIKSHFTKKQIITACTILGILVIGLLSWVFIFSRYYIFSKEEKAFLEAVKTYYYYHPEYLPKEGYVRTKTLKDVYDENRLEELKVPKRKEICDLDSWVKVYNDNDKYVYNTYLKCGRFESKTDHTGPVITLKGNDTVYVSVNDTYEELGVESVKDNKDGQIDTALVTIDSSKVDTKKLGEYKVTYRVKDKMNNITTKERTVKVVRNLTNIVRNATNESEGYYKGLNNKNYVLLSGILFNIIKVNEDGTLLLVSKDNISNLRFNGEKYKGSNAEDYLNNVFLKAIYDDSYIVEKEYCTGSIDSLEDITNSCSETIKSKVTLLSVEEFQKTFNDKNESYLCSEINFVLSNNTVNNESVVVSRGNNNCLGTVEKDTLPVIRPVVTLKSNAPLASGLGTIDNPYKLEDYQYAKTGEKVGNRLIGEYVNYSNTNFRILAKDKDKVVLIGADGMKQILTDNYNRVLLTVTVPEIDNYTYNTKDIDNPGYVINSKHIDYINDSNIITNKYLIPTNEKDKKYSKFKTEEVEAKIALPKTYDLFSSVQINDTGYLYLYLDKSPDGKVFYLNRTNGMVYEKDKNIYGPYGVKPVITVSKDMVIRSGKGTAYEPYYLGK